MLSCFAKSREVSLLLLFLLLFFLLKLLFLLNGSSLFGLLTLGSLDPEAFSGKYPPPIRMYSKYERRTDTRTYEDRKKLYEGGWEVIRAESLDAIWKEKFEEWSKRPSKKLPKWFGERPGKKAGDAPTPEGEEDGGEEAAAEEDYEEEEEEEEEYDEEE